MSVCSPPLNLDSFMGFSAKKQKYNQQLHCVITLTKGDEKINMPYYVDSIEIKNRSVSFIAGFKAAYPEHKLTIHPCPSFNSDKK
jgi:hypothetical protein